MNLAEILKKEKIEIEENIDDVFQYGLIDLNNIENPEDFMSLTYYAKDLETKYDTSKTTYSIYQNGVLIQIYLTEKDIREFFKYLKNKYK